MNVAKLLLSSAALLLASSALFFSSAHAAVTIDDMQGSTPPAGTVAKSPSSWGAPSAAIDRNIHSMWNAPSRVGTLELQFPAPQELTAVQIAVNATPASLGTYRVYGLQNNVWREISTVKSLWIPTNTPTILDPFEVTPGEYTAIRFSVSTSASWAAINEVTLLPGETADETAPQTTLRVTGQTGDNGFYTSHAQLELSATDDLSGVERTEYRLNNGEWTTYTGPISLTDGLYTIEYRSVDKAGNLEAVQTSSLIQVDTTAPSLNLSLSESTLWSPNHKLVPVQVTVDASDAASGLASVVLTSITSNEPDEGTGDGDQANDIQNAAFGTNDTAFDLRAERSGNGTGRVYTITYTATDLAGNVTTATATVTVPHSKKK